MRVRRRNRTAARGRLCATLGLFSLAVAGGAAGAGGVSGSVGERKGEDPGDRRLLPRSIYVPVEFEVSACLRNVVIRNDEGRVRAVAPGRLVSQFTWYEGRRGLAPEWERLTVEGEIVSPPQPESPAEAGRRAGRFRAALVITPTSIYLGSKRVDLGPGLDRTLGDASDAESGARVPRLRRQADLRVPKTKLRIRPAGECDEPAGPVEAAAGHPPRSRH